MSFVFKNVKELRIHLRPSSIGPRNFIENNYLNLKKLNPTVPILVREADVDAVAYARYAFGVERKANLEGLSESDVQSRIKDLVERPPQ